MGLRDLKYMIRRGKVDSHQFGSSPITSKAVHHHHAVTIPEHTPQGVQPQHAGGTTRMSADLSFEHRKQETEQVDINSSTAGGGK